ncbi:ABC transporter permease (plasmid) [Agrobacterium vitis]|uniref:ABC transporter permease n=1 Tax=Agrobacterium vitis TaxID=373 RepID=UPI0012E97B38|nr:ABC transporter permease [Agrobacterium vitis]MVA27706.1 ABC transporter permease subunit [Agrobacterium vitis]
MNITLILEVLPHLLGGALLTAELTVTAVVAGFLIAVPLSLLRASPSLVVSAPVQFYTFLFRGTPLLVQLFLIYYGASQIGWLRASPAWIVLRDPYGCALIAFSLNHAAYATEILAGGIRAVPKGEVEAAKALGMPALLRMRRIIFPNALRLSFPAYGNEVVLMLKASSLASTITLMELTGTARKLVAQTFSPYEVFVSAALVYLGLTLVLVHIFACLERHLANQEKRSSEVNEYKALTNVTPPLSTKERASQ